MPDPVTKPFGSDAIFSSKRKQIQTMSTQKFQIYNPQLASLTASRSRTDADTDAQGLVHYNVLFSSKGKDKGAHVVEAQAACPPARYRTSPATSGKYAASIFLIMLHNINTLFLVPVLFIKSNIKPVYCAHPPARCEVFPCHKR